MWATASVRSIWWPATTTRLRALSSRLSFTSVAGTTYWIAIDGFNGATGNLVLRWNQTLGPPPPENDDFVTASVIGGTIGAFSALNANATQEPGEPFHAANDGGHSVWYQWTAPVGSPDTFDTFGSSFDTLLAVYTGNSVQALTQIAGNNDFDATTKASHLTFTPTAGMTTSSPGRLTAPAVISCSPEPVGPWLFARLDDLGQCQTNYVVTNRTF
jgi:hypothetical protein